MRSYAQIVPTFWTRGSGKKLRGKPIAQILALYLMTAPASNLIGLYYLPMTTLCHETGLTERQVLDTLALDVFAEIARYDPDAELVFVPEAARYQIGERMSAGDKRRLAVLRELVMVGRHEFRDAFVRRYAAAFGLEELDDGQEFDQGAYKGHPPPRKGPDPDPAPVPDPSSDPEGVQGEEPDGKIDCPIDLRLTDNEFKAIALGTGIKRWQADVMAANLVPKFVSQDPRPIGAWHRSLVTAITKDWTDPSKRPKQPEPPADPEAIRRKREAVEAAGRAQALAALDADAFTPEEGKSAVAAVLGAARASSARGAA